MGHPDDSELMLRLEAELDALAEAVLATDRDAEVADYIAVDRATWRLAARINGSCGRWIDVQCAGGHHIAGRVDDVGDAHAQLVGRRSDIPIVLMLHSIHTVCGLASSSMPMGEHPRLLGSILREWKADGVPVTAALVSGSSVNGVIAHVHKDHVDLTTASGDVTIAHAAIAALIPLG